MATGAEGGAYRLYGERFAARLADVGIQVELRETAGALENLALLDNDDTIDVRMGAARSEISHWEEADYLIINDDFDTALTELRAVVHSLRLRTSQQRIVLDELINSLLAP